MKIQMNSILALCFLVMLSVGIDGDVKCLGCSKVGPDNECITKPYECTAGKWRFCFIERFSRMGKFVRVRRGCTSFCKSETQLRWDYRLMTWCCYRERCNFVNVWY